MTRAGAMRVGRMLAGALAIGLAMPAIAAEVPEPPADPAFESALAAHDLSAAAASLDRMIDARLARAGAAPDPAINRQIGRFLLAADDPRAALAWLEAAGPARGELAFDRARALLLAGQARDALAHSDTAIRDLTDPARQSAAQRLRIDALLAVDPVAAVAALTRAAPLRAQDPGNEWDWALLDARAALLTGAADAAAKARHAWTRAPGAPVTSAAPARAAALMTMVEEQAGNRSGAVAMMALATREAPDASLSPLIAMLPACGATVTPADQLTVALHRDSIGGNGRVSAIAASRPDIVAAFLTGVEAKVLLGETPLLATTRIIRLRCRIGPASQAVARRLEPDRSSGFLARRGLFPRFGGIGPIDEQLNATAREVDRMTQLHGTDSPALFGPLLRLAMLTRVRLDASGDIPPARLKEAVERLARVVAVAAAGDTDPQTPQMIEYLRAAGRATSAATPADARKVMDEAFQSVLGSVDPGTAYAMLAKVEDTEPAALDRMRAGLIGRARAAFPPGDARITALAVARVEAARTEFPDTLAARIRETGLPRDLCALQPASPVLEDIGITDDDYPPEAILAGMTGRTMLEFDIAASGQVRAPRALIAWPPILFDPIVAERADGIRYAKGGTGCRAQSISIRWKLPEVDDAPDDSMSEDWSPDS